MAQKIYLTFSDLNKNSSQEFEWDVCSTPLAEKWFANLAQSVASPKLYREQIFRGWATRNEDLYTIVDKLNVCISKINKYYGSRYHIPEQAYFGMDQDRLNALHHHFELLIGQSWNLSELNKNAPMDIQIATRGLNDFIHNYEAAVRTQHEITHGIRPTRFFQFQLTPFVQKPLSLEDLRSFTFECSLGDMVTNYCQLGKTWLEVCNDNDDYINIENISPLRYYTSSFNCLFYDIARQEAESCRKSVKEYIRHIMDKNGQSIDLEDPRLALGHAVYARLPKHSDLLQMTEEERCNFFQHHSNIACVRMVSGTQEVKRRYKETLDYYGEDRLRRLLEKTSVFVRSLLGAS